MLYQKNSCTRLLPTLYNKDWLIKPIRIDVKDVNNANDIFFSNSFVAFFPRKLMSFPYFTYKE